MKNQQAPKEIQELNKRQTGITMFSNRSKSLCQDVGDHVTTNSENYSFW
jgi:hypothetical protein